MNIGEHHYGIDLADSYNRALRRKRFKRVLAYLAVAPAIVLFLASLIAAFFTLPYLFVAIIGFILSCVAAAWGLQNLQ